VARQLQIPFRVLDLETEFRDQIVSYFIREYLRGRTPIPCLFCNRRVKFGTLMQEALAGGASYLASGHYARITYDAKGGRYLLWRSPDPHKDQSYFLSQLTQEQLAHLILPLEHMRKEEVRRLAGELGIGTAQRPESQELCFVSRGDYRQFLRNMAGDMIKPGPIRDHKGHLLGEHKGLAFYTIGQRKGLRLAGGRPFFVVELRPDSNEVVVGEEKDLWRSDMVVEGVNWIPSQELPGRTEAWVKIRYQHAGAKAFITPMEGGRAWVSFAAPQRAITPGQAAVFYQGDLVLGGGIIACSLPGPNRHGDIRRYIEAYARFFPSSLDLWAAT
jgi:tRNA-specific 2-thiouridylase